MVLTLSLLATGISTSSVRMRTLSITTLLSLLPKPRRSKYSVASVLGAMSRMSTVTVRGLLRLIEEPLVSALDILTLSLKYVSPSCWMLSNASVWENSLVIPARGVLVLVLRRATSKASPGARLLLSRSASRMVNCRYLASLGMMKSWVKLLRGCFKSGGLL